MNLPKTKKQLLVEDLVHHWHLQFPSDLVNFKSDLKSISSKSLIDRIKIREILYPEYNLFKSVLKVSQPTLFIIRLKFLALRSVSLQVATI